MAAHHHHQRYVVLFLVIFFSCFINSSYGYDHQFLVGWVLNPSEKYNKWAEINRFQVNDSLLFKYENGSDSVLVVNENDYHNCNTGNPILKLNDGNSVFKFVRSGLFYFISVNTSNCNLGQKLIVLVLAVRNRPTPPSTALSPAGAPPKSSSPSSSPTGTEAPSPATSPSPTSPAPASSAWSPSPATPAPSPAAGSAWSPSPAAEAPTPSIHSGGPSPASEAPVPAINGSGPSPADVNSTGGSPQRSLAAPPCTPSILFVSFVLSVGLGGFIVSN